MAGAVPLADAVHRDERLGFAVLGLGDAHLAPPSLLEMRFRDLLAQTEADYDVVLVHAGPVSESEDARIMAIDGALLLTVASGSVHPRTLQRAVAHLRMVRTRILGVVLTDSRGASR
jgi:Mrp family chromosome partitioning ATPase